MKKRKKYYQVFLSKLLISVPFLVIAVLLTIFTLKQFSYSLLNKRILENTSANERFHEVLSEKNFEEAKSFLNFNTRLRASVLQASMPGITTSFRWLDEDGNEVLNAQEALVLLYSIKDENYEVLEQDYCICNIDYIKQYDEIKPCIESAHVYNARTALQYIYSRNKDYYDFYVMDGYLDKDTHIFYPGNCIISYKESGYFLLLGQYNEDAILFENGENTTIDITPSDTTGLVKFTRSYESLSSSTVDGENATVFVLIAGDMTDPDTFEKQYNSPSTISVEKTSRYVDCDGNEYHLQIRATDNFVQTYSSLIVLLAVIYTITDLLICFVLSILNMNKLKYFYQNEDYRKALMNSMAHDLKTPLTAMSGYAENLKENVQTDKREHYADAILENTAYMNNVITDVLNLSKVEEQTKQKSKEKIDFCTVATEIKERYKDALEEKNLSLDITGSFIRKGSKAGIERVMDNLIGNAIKYTDNGGKINIHAKDTPFSSHSVTIENSPIKPLRLKPNKLWDPFVKDDESRSDKSGTGLGLSIARNILQSYGFKAKIKSKGTSFRIIIK